MYDRPTTWDDFHGQPKLKEHLQLRAKAAATAGVPLDHILLVGPPGCGKTTLAQLIAEETGVPFWSYIMPMKPMLLRRTVEEATGILFLDEVHRCSDKEQEALLPLIEDGYIQCDNGERIFNPEITVIAATTEREKIIKPLWDRFTIRPHFDPYTEDDMGAIVQSMADAAGVWMETDESLAYGRAAGGIPRNARSLVGVIRDIILARSEIPTVEEVLAEARITPGGLTVDHVDYLRTLRSAGGQVGLELICSLMRLPRPVVLDLERLLLDQKLIRFTKQGRELTSTGFKVMSKETC